MNAEGTRNLVIIRPGKSSLIYSTICRRYTSAVLPMFRFLSYVSLRIFVLEFDNYNVYIKCVRVSFNMVPLSSIH